MGGGDDGLGNILGAGMIGYDEDLLLPPVTPEYNGDYHDNILTSASD